MDLVEPVAQLVVQVARDGHPLRDQPPLHVLAESGGEDEQQDRQQTQDVRASSDQFSRRGSTGLTQSWKSRSQVPFCRRSARASFIRIRPASSCGWTANQK